MWIVGVAEYKTGQTSGEIGEKGKYRNDGERRIQAFPITASFRYCTWPATPAKDISEEGEHLPICIPNRA